MKSILIIVIESNMMEININKSHVDIMVITTINVFASEAMNVNSDIIAKTVYLYNKMIVVEIKGTMTIEVTTDAKEIEMSNIMADDLNIGTCNDDT